MSYPIKIKGTVNVFTREKSSKGTSLLAKSILQQSLANSRVSSIKRSPWVVVSIPSFNFVSSGSSPHAFEFEIPRQIKDEIIFFSFYSAADSTLKGLGHNSKSPFDDPMAKIAQPLNSIDLYRFCSFKLYANGITDFSQATTSQITEIFNNQIMSSSGKVRVSLSYTPMEPDLNELKFNTYQSAEPQTCIEKGYLSPTKENLTKLSSDNLKNAHMTGFIGDFYTMTPNDSASNVIATQYTQQTSNLPENNFQTFSPPLQQQSLVSNKPRKSFEHQHAISKLVMKSQSTYEILCLSTCITAWKSFIHQNRFNKTIFEIFKPYFQDLSVEDFDLTFGISTIKKYVNDSIVNTQKNDVLQNRISSLEKDNEFFINENKNLKFQLKSTNEKFNIFECKFIDHINSLKKQLEENSKEKSDLITENIHIKAQLQLLELSKKSDEESFAKLSPPEQTIKIFEQNLSENEEDKNSSFEVSKFSDVASNRSNFLPLTLNDDKSCISDEFILSPKFSNCMGNSRKLNLQNSKRKSYVSDEKQCRSQ